MKLIDLLVQELPKRGGWPEGVTHIGQDYDRELMFYGRGRARTEIFLDELAIDHRKCGGNGEKITKEQYESALAASQKPAWNGEGLPPVGCECEVSVDGGRSWCTYRAINEKNGVRLIEIGNLTEEFENDNWIFRPLPTESERKRNAAAKEMARHANSDEHRKFNAGLRNCLSIYDAIAAGKIPGVKLDD